LPDETLLERLRGHYGLMVTELTFLPLGHDAAAWMYRVRTGGGRMYFLKVRLGVTNEAGLLVPRYLKQRGVARVVAPLPTVSGAPWTSAADYALILYPFVPGRTGMQQGMSERQWVDYGVLLRQIHETHVTSDLARILKRDCFKPDGADTLRRLDAHVATRTFDDPAADTLATFWGARVEQIRMLLDGAEDLGVRLAGTAPAFVLCHADIHTNNLLLDPDQQVWIVDWDDTILAPRERDLMFVVGGIIGGLVGPREQALFFEGYGPVAVDPLALAYYRYARAVSDIGAYGEQVFYRPDLGSATRHEAVDRFMSLFAPGNIVALAIASGPQ
jgi:spectinomycin phosphotransferase